MRAPARQRRRHGLLRAPAAWLAFAVGLMAAGVAVPARAASPAPSVRSIAPASGSSVGGTRVTIRGHGLRAVERVYFGRVRAHWVAVVSRSELLVAAPAHAPGRVNVRVVVAGGRSPLTTADRFLYVAPPRVTAVSPARGDFAGGMRVTIYGSGFRRGATVRFGSVAATGVTVLSSSRLTAAVPAHPAGVIDVRVGTGYGISRVSSADEFSYIASIPSTVSDIRVARTDTSVTLTWADPVGERVRGVRVVRGAGEQMPSPTGGTLVADVGASTTTITDSGLAPGAMYTYVFYVYDLEPYYSEGTVRTVTTRADTGIQWGTPTVVSPSTPLTSVSCPTDSFCAALDYQGNARTFDGSAWSTPIPARSATFQWQVGLSCASATFCAAPDGSGRVVTFDGTSWSAPTTVDTDVKTYSWQDLSCTAPAFCVGVLSGGYAVVFDGTEWSQPQYLGIGTVSCTSVTFCLGASVPGTYRTFDGTDWSAAAPITTVPAFCPSACGGYLHVACSSPTHCVAASNGGKPVATFDGANWAVPITATATEYLSQAACSSTDTCVAYLGGYLTSASPNGGPWSPAIQPDPNYGVTRISCAPSFCMAVAGAAAMVGTWP